ncbi:hypothetical protein [Rhizobium sp. MHM7A]|uniref:hypothetical protein n=1 Tax=Rhizobium sp. MHM7A TaxID=2583233 RepID=UPI001106EF16|nr:hypothetical protein [Rhizobium sp. MHM7A]TLX16393.1 hypothetical protein FFR93_03405 [Rhizobium sp. MHM7A]
MSAIITVADLVEANGKTVRENNQGIPHELPLGALVEITTDCPIGEFGSVYKGVRLFVVAHDRDCDGSPLYSLSFDQNVFREIEGAQTTFDDNRESKFHSLFAMSLGKAKGSISDGWGSDSLLLIDPQPATRRMAATA